MVRDDGHDPLAAPGSAATYLCLGPGWSNCSNTPFRRHKTWVHEGGIATPLIAHWPQGIQARGELRRTVGHVIDIVPTILEVAGASRFTTWNDKPVPTPPGRSLRPAFASAREIARDDLWWSHEGNRAIRVGDWKLVAAGRDGPWELFDLGTDRTETNDLAEKHPAKANELAQRWSQHEREFVALASQDVPKSSPNPKRKQKKN
jgi:arylsulfatase